MLLLNQSYLKCFLNGDVKSVLFCALDLERLLQETQNARMRLIVTDGVFSMDGNVAPLRWVSTRSSSVGCCL